MDSSGGADKIDWSKIETPTGEVLLPYASLAPPPEGFFFLFIFLGFNCLLDSSFIWERRKIALV